MSKHYGQIGGKRHLQDAWQLLQSSLKRRQKDQSGSEKPNQSQYVQPLPLVLVSPYLLALFDS